MALRSSMPPSRFKGEPCRSRGWTLNILGRRSIPLRKTPSNVTCSPGWDWRSRAGSGLILIFDRAYARVELIKDLKHGQQPFLIRGRHKVIVQTKVRGRQRRLSVGRLRHRMGRPPRDRPVLDHVQEAEPVDVSCYRGKGFQWPWFLI